LLYREEIYKHYTTLEEGLTQAKTDEEKKALILKFNELSKE